jgi:hypothetical protein
VNFTSCRYCSFTTDFPSVLEQHMADAHGLQRGVPEQPVEPAPPNRWKAFTNEELAFIEDAVEYQGNPNPVRERDEQRHLFHPMLSEIETEQKRRRIQQ